jgi:hypothetical protein
MPPRPSPALVVRLTTLAVAVRAAAEADSKPSAPRVSGWIDTYYVWNANRPADGANFAPGTGTSAKRANEFSISQAAVELLQVAEPAARLGYHLVFGFGSGFEIVHAAEPIGPGIGPNVWQHLLTASLSWLVPVGRGLTVESGVFPCHVGLETFPSKDSWHETRSWLGEYSPYYQAGLKASYAFTDHLSAQLHLLNGWQLIGENNEGKMLGVQLAWTGDRGSLTLNGLFGPELAHDGEHWRLFGDLVAVLKATDALTFAANVDVGRQGLPGDTAANWFGVAGYARFALDSTVALTARVEVYRDAQGAITGTGETLAEGTLTCEWRPVEQLILKAEGRYDHSTADVFGTSHGSTDHELLALASGVVTF